MDRKRITCPICQSHKVVNIFYGMPTTDVFERQLKAQAWEDKIVLGGCCITPDSPKWHCTDCEHSFGILEDE